MTIYILGAGGYIGSHLLAAFLNENNEDKNIVAVDRNLEYLSDFPVEKVKMDLAKKVPDFKDGDIVYHLATKKNYPSQFDREGAFRDIFVSTKNVVNAVRNKDVFLIFGSSRSVYGRTSGLVNEDHPLEPVTYYGVLKKKCERMIKTLDNYAIIRLSNVYGGYRPYDPYMGVADLFQLELKVGSKHLILRL
jgi:nucleoside-diphosphate-sugar epimerase